MLCAEYCVVLPEGVAAVIKDNALVDEFSAACGDLPPRMEERLTDYFIGE